MTDATQPGVSNRAGLRAVDYRSGTWAQFRERMLDALSTVPELGALRTRSTDDFSIALLDSWAVVCDILTFYQERIANESYLRTATETLSVGELAKLIGYKLRPGLAAAAPLAFTLDAPLATAPSPNAPPTGSPGSVVLPAGTRGQTVPEPGRLPATFETLAPITARAGWNAIALRTRRPEVAGTGTGANVRLDGIATGVRPGDELLVTVDDQAAGATCARVVAVEVDTPTQTTLVRFEPDAMPVAAPDPTAAGTESAGAALDDDFVWTSVRDHVWADQDGLVAFAAAQGWSVDAVGAQINALRDQPPPGTPRRRVWALGVRSSLFGHNAQDWTTLPAATRPATSWNGNTLNDLTVAVAASTSTGSIRSAWASGWCSSTTPSRACTAPSPSASRRTRCSRSAPSHGSVR